MANPPTANVPAEHLADVLDIAEDGVISVNQRREIVLFNRGASRIFGYAPAEIFGKQLEELLPVSHRAGHVAQVDGFSRGPDVSRIMGDRRVVSGLRKDGTEFPAEVTICKLERGGETLLTAIVRDATSRKRYEDALMEVNHQLEDRVKDRTADLQAKTDELRAATQQLWQAARLAGVGELAASIAHELNNPLGTVSLRIEEVLGKTPQNDPRRRSLEIIEQEVERMASLVGNLLHFSRAGRDQVSTVNVPEEVVKAIELTDPHLRRKGVMVTPVFLPNVPNIYADRQQLRQVLLNLFTNAGDAMPKGGKLIPRVRPGVLPGDRAAVILEVSDTGTGIATDVLNRVFDPFFTTKEEGKGTGLGLAICKRIVEQHQGTLHIESEVGQGTTVRVALPVCNAANVSELQITSRK